MKVILENFQSISCAELDFIEGLNVITGNNSQGKTCLMRALYGLIFNPKRTRKGFKKNTNGYIKNGEDYCRVSVFCKGYPDITWVCEKEHSYYVIDGKKYTKSVGGINLLDLVPNHPFSIFGTECMNLSLQNSKALLFDRNANGVFNLIEKLYEIVDTTGETQNFKQYKNVLYNQKDLVMGKIDSLEDEKNKILNLREKISLEKLEKAFLKYKDMKDKNKKLEEINKLIRELKELKEVENVNEVVDRVKLSYSLEDLMKKIKLLDSYRGVEYPEINLNNYENLKKVYELITERKLKESLLTEGLKDFNLKKQSVIGTICSECGQVIKEVNYV